MLPTATLSNPQLSLDARSIATHRPPRSYYQIMDVSGLGLKTKEWGYYDTCPCNEVDALINRHALCEQVPDSAAISNMRLLASSVALQFRREHPFPQRWDHATLMHNTRLKIRGRYDRAYRNLSNGMMYSLGTMSKIQTFIKFEKMPIEKLEERKPARLIQHRSYEYLYLMKSVFGPLSEHIKKSEVIINNSGQQLKEIFGVGLTNQETANRIHSLFLRHKDCVVLCLDHSKWDGHFNEVLMSNMHDFWDTVTKNNRSLNKLVKRLLTLQRVNNGRTKGGIRYRTPFARMSGEYTTSIENSLANYFLLQTTFPNASILVCGDDSLIFLDRKDFEGITESWIKEQMALFGQDTKVDRIAYTMEEIDFCQCSPIEKEQGSYVMVRKPERLLSRIQYTDYKVNEQNIKKFRNGLALCELANCSGIPILQQFCKHIIENNNFSGPSEQAKPLYDMVNEQRLHLEEVKDLTRVSFEKAFGISVQQQLDVERRLSTKEDKRFEKYLSKHHNFMPTQGPRDI